MKGFKQFILRGNVVDLAVGVVVGAAFGNIVTALVTDILTPLIGAIVRIPTFSKLEFSINGSTFMYGNFFNTLISFIIILATVYFFVVTPINALVARSKKEEPLDSTTKKCPECISEIALGARRCPACTSQLE